MTKALFVVICLNFFSIVLSLKSQNYQDKNRDSLFKKFTGEYIDRRLFKLDYVIGLKRDSTFYKGEVWKFYLKGTVCEGKWYFDNDTILLKYNTISKDKKKQIKGIVEKFLYKDQKLIKLSNEVYCDDRKFLGKRKYKKVSTKQERRNKK